MKILLTNKTIILAQRLSKYNFFQTRSCVDLAHKIYGNLGSSVPVIVLHGLLGSKKNWNSISQQISKNTKRAVVAVDARNHGESPHADSHDYRDLAADVDSLMRKLSIPEATLIGHSMGGRTAMVLALTKPVEVASLIVVDISPVSAPSLLSDFFPRLMNEVASIHFEGEDLGKAKEKARKHLEASGIVKEPGFIQFLLMSIGKKGGKISWMFNADALNRNFSKIATFPSEVAGKVYQGPTLFIAGENSNFVRQEDLTGIKKIFPQVALQYIAGAGHNVHVDAPAAFINLVTKFISEYSLK